MVIHVDRDAGFAAFRQGGSLCVRLDGELTPETSRRIAERILDGGDAVRLRLECSTLSAIQPDAPRVLASAILAWCQRRDDRSVDVLNLDPALQSAVAWHPLRAVTEPGAALFFDPDHEPGDAAVPPASRH